MSSDEYSDSKSKDNSNVILSEKVIKYIRRVNRPVFVGAIACEVGVSLKRVDIVVSELVSSGSIRYLTEEELHGVNRTLPSAVVVAVTKE